LQVGALWTMKNVAMAVHGEPVERLLTLIHGKRSALTMENVALSLKLQTTGATMRNVALASKRK
jgi:hypothetical protein